jgi:hypothetical protein
VPQAELLCCVTQSPFRQQPFGQLVGLQTVWHSWFTQLLPVGHFVQAAPIEPQAAALLPSLQMLPRQQPAQLEHASVPSQPPNAISSTRLAPRTRTPFRFG